MTSSGSPASSDRDSPRWAILLAGGLIAVAAVAAYHNIFSAPFVFDGLPAIEANTSIRRLWPVWPVLSPPPSGATVSGRPILNLSLAINHAISGEEVWSYHAVNLAIHVLAGLTLFGLARRTFLRPELCPRFGAAALPLACVLAGLWVLHPLQTESVTYTIQRAESLMGLFYLLTLYAFVRAVKIVGPIGDQPDCRPRQRVWLGLSFVACLLGMATKEVMASAPLLVLVYDRTFVSGSFRAAWWARRRYYLALAATWILLGLLVTGTRSRGGTVGFDTGLSPAMYALSQCQAIVAYLGLSFWPNPLVFDYGIAVARHLSDVWPAAVLLAAVLATTALALWRRPVVGFAGLWFFAILAPSSSFIPVGTQTMAEHRMYLPLAAVIALAVAGLHAALGRRSLVLWPLLALMLGCLTLRRNEIYRSDLALWSDTVAKSPLNSRARYNLALAFSARGRFAEAIPHYEAALRLDDGTAPVSEIPVIHTKLGHHLVMAERAEEAIAHYREALRLKPDYALAHYNLAKALILLDRFPEAIDHYEEALRLNLGGGEARADLAYALLHEGRIEEAIPHYREALRREPAAAPGHNNLAYALLVTGRIDAAIAEYREALRLNPRYATAAAGLGYALIQAHRPDEAIAACEQALRLRPDYADAHNFLGIALAQTHRATEAIAHFDAALSLDPVSADVHNNLANALADLGRGAEAIAHYEKAVRLKPDYADAHRSLAQELARAGRAAEAALHAQAAERLDASR